VTTLYVKVFQQILESSISEDYQQRHIFEDLLKLADREGTVDMTHEAISRRLNVPLEVVRRNIELLEQPDKKSRSQNEDGRRIVRLAEHRDWGWRIVNYTFYRDLIDQESLRIANRQRKREERARKRKKVTDGHGHSVTSCDPTGQSVTNGSLNSHSYSSSVSGVEESREGGGALPFRGRSNLIDLRNPPWQHGGVLAREDVQAAIKDLLRYQEERHGVNYTRLEFNSLMNRFGQVTSAKEVCRICDECIAKKYKNPVFPDQGTFQR
jgi:hypothetical protein